eukprot:4238947-Pyramimonas_sp.AAC.1
MHVRVDPYYLPSRPFAQHTLTAPRELSLTAKPAPGCHAITADTCSAASFGPSAPSGFLPDFVGTNRPNPAAERATLCRELDG